jgi:hypothetical protein
VATLTRKNIGGIGGLAELARSMGGPRTLKIGFLKGATYPDGTSVPMVAAVQEFGGRIEREPSDPDEGGGQTIYRQVNAAGTEFLRGGRFVPRARSNFASTHYVGAYVINIPARPFFRNMIAEQSPKWGKMAGAMLRSNGGDVDATLDLLGQEIQGRLKESINTLMTPPLAASTIARKGHSKPLIDTAVMLNSISFEVLQE